MMRILALSDEEKRGPYFRVRQGSQDTGVLFRFSTFCDRRSMEGAAEDY